jgi:growth factor-regulated tyrosine kinase substrate
MVKKNYNPSLPAPPDIFTNLCSDALLDLHSKLATVVRYYDRMLEDRLSKTYNQPIPGYGPMPSMHQPSSSAYPTLSAAPSTIPAGNIESYYGAAAVPAEPYGRPQSTYSGYPVVQSPYAQHAAPRQQFSRQPSETPYSPAPQSFAPPGYYESNAQQAPQRTSSMSYPTAETPAPQYASQPSQPYPSQAPPHSDVNPSHHHHQLAPSQPPQMAPSQPPQMTSSQPPQMTPSEPPASVALDPAMAFYFPDRAAAEAQPSTQHTQSSPSQSRQPVPYQQVTPSAPQHIPSPPQPTPHGQTTKQHILPATAPQHYAVQNQAPSQAPGQQWPQQPFTASVFSPESFPTVPQHQPKQEEALIEL